MVLCILLPGLMYSWYFLTEMTENERQLQEVYSRQLDAIIFSVNNSALDITGNWFQTARLSAPEQISTALKNFPDVKGYFWVDTSLSTFHLSTAIKKSDINDLVLELKPGFDRLLRMAKNGYYRQETLPTRDSLTILYAVLSAEKATFLGLIVQPEQLIIKQLYPRLNALTPEFLRFSVNHIPSGRMVVSNDTMQTPTYFSKKIFWLFPNYQLGIRLSGGSITDTLDSRYQLVTLIISGFVFILIVGVGFIFKMVTKEIEIAQLKTDFVATVSHELRTPLALIRMHAETLTMGRVSAEERKNDYYHLILSESERLSRLVNSILNFAKLEAGKKTYHFQPIDVNKQLKNIVSLYQHKLSAEGFKLNTQLSTNLPIIQADGESMDEIFHNLIDNAMKYSKETKEISITTSIQGKQVQIEITDKGIGISPQQQKRIFEKFYRAESHLLAETKGSGLGLAVVKELVDANHGNISVLSALGKGTTFTLKFTYSQPTK